MSEPELKIDWSVGGILPATGERYHPGVAGPVSGIAEDVLVVAGGANFPNGMPWEGGAKQYTKESYHYSIANTHLKLKQTEVFEDSLAYSANVTVGKVFYSIGGERMGQATADVFCYLMKGNKLHRKALSFLPEALTNGAATQVGDYIYFVGGENADKVSDKIYRLNIKSSKYANWEEYASLPYAVSHAVVVSDGDSRIYIAGGRKRNLNSKSKIYNALYELQIETNKITNVDTLPEAIAAGIGVFYKGNIILIGGDNAKTFHRVEELIGAINLEVDETKKADLIRKKNAIQSSHPGFVHDVWIYDIKTKSWKKTDPIKGASPVTTTAILKDDLIIIPSGEIRAGVRTDQILIGKIK